MRGDWQGVPWGLPRCKPPGSLTNAELLNRYAWEQRFLARQKGTGTVDKAEVWRYCEEYPDDPLAISRAREVALELGADPVTPGTGALLQTLAAAKDARAVAEIGTGAGVSGLYLLAGMNEDGVLTTIDPEAEFQRAARDAFKAASVSSHRTRFINDRALDVLGRMATSAYDLVVIDAIAEETPRYLDHAARMLRPKGMLIIVDALQGGRVADPAKRDAKTVIMREMTKALLESPQFIACLLPVGNGVEIATRV